jgi:hypothetical protein
MLARRAVVAAVALGALSLACGGGGGPTTGGAIKGSVSNAVIALPVSIDATPAIDFVVDSGSPVTLVDPSTIPAAMLQGGFNTVSTLDVGHVHLTNVPVFGASPCGMMMCTGSQPSGLLGGDVLLMFAVTIDYRNATVAFDATSFPAGTGAPITVPFMLQGGGTSTLAAAVSPVAVPATRISLDVNIEGTTYPFVLDTGSSSVVLDGPLYDSIVADGRPQDSIDVSTVTGTVTEPITSLHQVSVGAATQMNVQAIRTPRDLDPIAREVGHPVRGLLGGSFLSRYLVTLDYPKQQLLLRAYP